MFDGHIQYMSIKCHLIVTIITLVLLSLLWCSINKYTTVKANYCSVMMKHYSVITVLYGDVLLTYTVYCVFVLTNSGISIFAQYLSVRLTFVHTSYIILVNHHQTLVIFYIYIHIQPIYHVYC